eukprot:CAMPEP_0197591104 /NCGR_PEP_ID=MMETSP1326-20131121/12881_1 /TAXON_ID=1155430 /ORGANISM="Genus nov. species nov., Strain RCC2288" /LENGTH=41 /DNA_ID= /DNA_START= /DNA_END= /DNA_ORIENTATION=
MDTTLEDGISISTSDDEQGMYQETTNSEGEDDMAGSDAEFT